MHSPPPAQPRPPPRHQALAPGSSRPYARRCQRQSLRPWPSAMVGCRFECGAGAHHECIGHACLKPSRRLRAVARQLELTQRRPRAVHELRRLEVLAHGVTLIGCFLQCAEPDAQSALPADHAALVREHRHQQ
eukprot:scaffold30004_cov72-Phaeocystis_antarctica.AAC.2